MNDLTTLRDGLGFSPACPQCGSTMARVTDSRLRADCRSIRRRRECANGHRYTTTERMQPHRSYARHTFTPELDFQI